MPGAVATNAHICRGYCRLDAEGVRCVGRPVGDRAGAAHRIFQTPGGVHRFGGAIAHGRIVPRMDFDAFSKRLKRTGYTDEK